MRYNCVLSQNIENGNKKPKKITRAPIIFEEKAAMAEQMKALDPFYFV